MINTRDKISEILKYDTIGCELGVFEGDFSNLLIKTNKFKKLYLVDLFDGLVQSGDKNGNNIKYIHGHELLNIVSNKFKNENRIEIIKQDSISFLNSFPDNFFDFIYIDTTHQYEHTKNELFLSLKKIKKGGIISGHDYNEIHFAGVFNAVNEFAEKNNLVLNITNSDILETFYFII